MPIGCTGTSVITGVAVSRFIASADYLPPLSSPAASARMQIAAEDDCPDDECPDSELTSDAALAGPAGPRSLLEELDARQNEVLDELEKLERRIEKVIAEWSAWRGESGEKTTLPNAA